MDNKNHKNKITKESRNLLIGMLIGDGTISNNNVFKLAHGEKQLEYIKWKERLLRNCGWRTNGIHSYTQLKGYNIGSTVYYTQLKTETFIKLLRKIVYNPKKNYSNIKLLNRIDTLGLAIWYLDDGHINHRITNGKIHGFYIKISTCIPKEEIQILIDWFKQKWNISFYPIKEGKNTFSLCCGTKEGIKFISLIKKHVKECPTMLYKIQYDLSQRSLPINMNRRQSLSRAFNMPEMQNTTNSSEDIV